MNYLDEDSNYGISQLSPEKMEAMSIESVDTPYKGYWGPIYEDNEFYYVTSLTKSNPDSAGHYEVHYDVTAVISKSLPPEKAQEIIMAKASEPEIVTLNEAVNSSNDYDTWNFGNEYYTNKSKELNTYARNVDGAMGDTVGYIVLNDNNEADIYKLDGSEVVKGTKIKKLDEPNDVYTYDVNDIINYRNGELAANGTLENQLQQTLNNENVDILKTVLNQRLGYNNIEMKYDSEKGVYNAVINVNGKEQVLETFDKDITLNEALNKINEKYPADGKTIDDSIENYEKNLPLSNRLRNKKSYEIYIDRNCYDSAQAKLGNAESSIDSAKGKYNTGCLTDKLLAAYNELASSSNPTTKMTTAKNLISTLSSNIKYSLKAYENIDKRLGLIINSVIGDIFSMNAYVDQMSQEGYGTTLEEREKYLEKTITDLTARLDSLKEKYNEQYPGGAVYFPEQITRIFLGLGRGFGLIEGNETTVQTGQRQLGIEGGALLLTLDFIDNNNVLSKLKSYANGKSWEESGMADVYNTRFGLTDNPNNEKIFLLNYFDCQNFEINNGLSDTEKHNIHDILSGAGRDPDRMNDSHINSMKKHMSYQLNRLDNENGIVLNETTHKRERLSGIDLVRYYANDWQGFVEAINVTDKTISNYKKYQALLPYEADMQGELYLEYLTQDWSGEWILAECPELSDKIMYMSQEEIALYCMYKGVKLKNPVNPDLVNNNTKISNENASGFLGAMDDMISQRHGLDEAVRDVEAYNNWLKAGNKGSILDYARLGGGVAFDGYVSGLEKFLLGVGTPPDGKKNWVDYRDEYILALLSEDDNAYQGLIDDNQLSPEIRGILKREYTAFKSVGYMTIPTMLSFVPGWGPVASRALLGVATFNNTTDNALQSGVDSWRAYLYGGLSAASTLAFNKIMSGISGLNGDPSLPQNASQFVTSMLKQGGRATTGVYVDAILRAGILGQPVDFSNLPAQAWDAAVNGMFTAAVLNGVNILHVKMADGFIYKFSTKYSSYQDFVDDYNAQFLNSPAGKALRYLRAIPGSGWDKAKTKYQKVYKGDLEKVYSNDPNKYNLFVYNNDEAAEILNGTTLADNQTLVLDYNDRGYYIVNNDTGEALHVPMSFISTSDNVLHIIPTADEIEFGNKLREPENKVDPIDNGPRDDPSSGGVSYYGVNKPDSTPPSGGSGGYNSGSNISTEYKPNDNPAKLESLDESEDGWIVVTPKQKNILDNENNDILDENNNVQGASAFAAFAAQRDKAGQEVTNLGSENANQTQNEEAGHWENKVELMATSGGSIPKINRVWVPESQDSSSQGSIQQVNQNPEPAVEPIAPVASVEQEPATAAQLKTNIIDFPTTANQPASQSSFIPYYESSGIRELSLDELEQVWGAGIIPSAIASLKGFAGKLKSSSTKTSPSTGELSDEQLEQVRGDNVPVSQPQTVQNNNASKSTIEQDVKNVIEFMNGKYQDGTGLARIKSYLASGNPNSITRDENCRSIISSIPVEQLKRVVSSLEVAFKKTSDVLPQQTETVSQTLENPTSNAVAENAIIDLETIKKAMLGESDSETDKATQLSTLYSKIPEYFTRGVSGFKSLYDFSGVLGDNSTKAKEESALEKLGQGDFSDVKEFAELYPSIQRLSRFISSKTCGNIAENYAQQLLTTGAAVPKSMQGELAKLKPIYDEIVKNNGFYFTSDDKYYHYFNSVELYRDLQNGDFEDADKESLQFAYKCLEIYRLIKNGDIFQQYDQGKTDDTGLIDLGELSENYKKQYLELIQNKLLPLIKKRVEEKVNPDEQAGLLKVLNNFSENYFSESALSRITSDPLVLMGEELSEFRDKSFDESINTLYNAMLTVAKLPNIENAFENSDDKSLLTLLNIIRSELSTVPTDDDHGALSNEYRNHNIRGDNDFMDHTADYHDIASIMANLNNDFATLMKEENKDEYIKQAGIIWYKFMLTHPYEDGNGRTGRLLLDTLLDYKDIDIPALFNNGSEQFALNKNLDKYILNKLTTNIDWDGLGNEFLKYIKGISGNNAGSESNDNNSSPIVLKSPDEILESYMREGMDKYSRYGLKNTLDENDSFFYRKGRDEFLKKYLGLAKTTKDQEVVSEILLNGGYDGMGFDSGLCSNNNRETEFARRLSMATLYLTSPETFDSLVSKDIKLFHGTNSSVLEEILNSGLTSAKQIEESGKKVSTGEYGDLSNIMRSGHDFVSFTDVFDLAYGYARSKDDGSFGIVLGTSKADINNSSKVSIHSDLTEVGVKGNFSADKIKVIMVPNDKVEYVKKLVGNRDIEVLPMDGYDKKTFTYFDELYVSDSEFDDLAKYIESLKNVEDKLTTPSTTSTNPSTDELSDEQLEGVLGYPTVNISSNQSSQDNNDDISQTTEIVKNVISLLNNKYKNNSGLAKLKLYLATEDKTYITRENNCRNIIANIPIDELRQVVKLLENSSNISTNEPNSTTSTTSMNPSTDELSDEQLEGVLGYPTVNNPTNHGSQDNNDDISQTTEIVKNVISLLNNKYKNNSGLAKLKLYLATEDKTYITRENNCRNIIANIPIDELRQVVKLLENSSNISTNEPTSTTTTPDNNTSSLSSVINRVQSRMNDINIISKIETAINEAILNGTPIYRSIVSINSTTPKALPTNKEIEAYKTRFNNGGYRVSADNPYFTHIQTPYFDLKCNVTERLYINNKNCSDTITFVMKFADECEKRGIPFYFKTANMFNGSNKIIPFQLKRDESVVIYSDPRYLSTYVDICNQIKEQTGMEFSSPPILTGVIDGYIGYGKEPNAENSSYNSLRASLLDTSVSEVNKKYASVYGFDVSNHERLNYFLNWIRGDSVLYSTYLRDLSTVIKNNCPKYGVDSESFFLNSN